MTATATRRFMGRGWYELVTTQDELGEQKLEDFARENGVKAERWGVDGNTVWIQGPEVK